ncbi:hypothetical protein [Phenylobacterium sp.]|jgi:hypothetical protein|uniref:hypothetical protein n=1 Tax=Phenylobacterium sp. TaxID=1871053 RepID=UPI002E30F38B|nr:hypothetical protein [Phenylobacterium sp.]HEX2558970.1 hypothetical protein [Phenylobacterium sp.]
MDERIGLSPDERALLEEALTGPVSCVRDGEDPLGPAARARLQVCVNLAGRGLFQRAVPRPGVRGWRPPPFAYLLTCEGWSLVKAQRMGRGHRGPPLRRTN